MDDPEQSPRSSQSTRFLVLYALAAGGGSASYAPFLTLYLPARLMTLYGDDAVQVMSLCAFAGAIAASLSNIVFGWISDRTGSRRGWIVAGLALSCILLTSMRTVETVPQLLAMIVAWQVSLNMMLAPLAAWAGDCVPDHQKGILGGLLSLAPGIGALVGALTTLAFIADGEARLIINAALVAAMVLPVLVLGRPLPMPHLTMPVGSVDGKPILAPEPGRETVSVARMWMARLLVQISEASLFAFLLLWLLGIDRSIDENTVARVFAFVLFAAVPFAILAGKWSDKVRRPMVPLVVAVAIAGSGLVVMSLSKSALPGLTGYVTFGIAASVFLALHSSQTLRVLPRPQHRGRDLGFFNLTNTIPSLVMPGIALALIPVFGFQALFAVLAALMFLAIPLLAGRWWRTRPA